MKRWFDKPKWLCWVEWMVLTILTLATISAPGQVLGIKNAMPEGSALSSRRMVRVIDDSPTGNRWVLVPDDAHPGGPGRLFRFSKLVERRGREGAGTETLNIEFLPVVRAGESILIEQHTSTADLRLEAVALEPARRGGVFHARLRIGGKTVRALAAGGGYALLEPEVGEPR